MIDGTAHATDSEVWDRNGFTRLRARDRLRHAAPVRCGVAELSGTYKLSERVAVPRLRWDKIQSCYNTAPTLPVTHTVLASCLTVLRDCNPRL